MTPKFSYEVQKGFFQQTEPGFCFSTEPLARFGLIDNSPDCWKRLVEKLESMNASAPVGTSYRLIFLARHGQGVHNLATDKYGLQAFLSYWSALKTDGELTWGPDPVLTEVGKQQARHVNSIWKKEVANGMPLPTAWYCSPLTRAAETLEISYDGLLNKSPLFIEDLREGLNVWHDVDWDMSSKPTWWREVTNPICIPDNIRSRKSELAKHFPNFTFEPGFVEEDERWYPDQRETVQAYAARIKGVFDRIFASDDTVIAISAHSGTCVAAQKILGLPLLQPPVCAVIPFLLKGQKI